MKVPLIVSSNSVSRGWAAALIALYERRSSDSTPLVLTIADFTSPLPVEDAIIRSAADTALSSCKKVPIDVSAMTIFPHQLWVRRGRPACVPFTKLCTERLAPRLKSLDQRNRQGLYFERMMEATGVKKGAVHAVRQLEFIIDLLKNSARRPRQSALQLSCFDPAKDHTRQTRRGFPCLQQVSLTYDGNRDFAVNAYYPTQYIFDRGYGNYLGLCHLGEFVAHETGYRFGRMTCFVARPEIGSVTKGKLRGLISGLKSQLDPSSQGRL